MSFKIIKKIICLLTELFIGKPFMPSLTAVFEKAEEGGYMCWIEEMPGVISEGETIQEAKRNLIEALELMMDHLREEAEKDLKYRNAEYQKETIEFFPPNIAASR